MKVFLDMDGVLADFDKPILDKFGTKEKWNNRWELLPKDFFRKLPKMPDADDLTDYVGGQFDWHVLTAIPTQNEFANSRLQKMQWLFEHYKIYPARIHCVFRSEKQYFAAEENLSPNLLVDDNLDNIAEFKAKGGIAIHHTSAENSIRELQQLGF